MLCHQSITPHCLSTALLIQGTYERGYGAVLDSGTTFTYLPSAAFVAFRNAVAAAAMHAGLHRAQGADPQVCV